MTHEADVETRTAPWSERWLDADAGLLFKCGEELEAAPGVELGNRGLAVLSRPCITSRYPRRPA